MPQLRGKLSQERVQVGWRPQQGPQTSRKRHGDGPQQLQLWGASRSGKWQTNAKQKHHSEQVTGNSDILHTHDTHAVAYGLACDSLPGCPGPQPLCASCCCVQGMFELAIAWVLAFSFCRIQPQLSSWYFLTRTLKCSILRPGSVRDDLQALRSLPHL